MLTLPPWFRYRKKYSCVIDCWAFRGGNWCCWVNVHFHDSFFIQVQVQFGGRFFFLLDKHQFRLHVQDSSQSAMTNSHWYEGCPAAGPLLPVGDDAKSNFCSSCSYLVLKCQSTTEMLHINVFASKRFICSRENVITFRITVLCEGTPFKY